MVARLTLNRANGAKLWIDPRLPPYLRRRLNKALRKARREFMAGHIPDKLPGNFHVRPA